MKTNINFKIIFFDVLNNSNLNIILFLNVNTKSDGPDQSIAANNAVRTRWIHYAGNAKSLVIINKWRNYLNRRNNPGSETIIHYWNFLKNYWPTAHWSEWLEYSFGIISVLYELNA